MNLCYQKYLVVLDISCRAEYHSEAASEDGEKLQIEEKGKREGNTD